MKTLKVFLLSFLFLGNTHLCSQSFKNHFFSHLHSSGQFSRPIVSNFTLDAKLNYFLTRRFNVGLQTSLNHTFTPEQKVGINDWGWDLRYYFIQNPKVLLFVSAAYRREKQKWSFLIHEINRTDFVNSRDISLGFGADYKIRSNIFFEHILDLKLTNWRYFFLSEVINEKNFFSLYSQFNFRALLPYSKSSNDQYRIVYFDNKDRFISGVGHVRYFGDTGQDPFSLDFSFSLGFFRDNNWMWGVDSRLGYFEFQGDEGIHLSVNPFIRYYFSIHSRKIRPYLMAQLEFTQHFSGSGFGPISGPIVYIGLNYFLSPQIALDLSLGDGVQFETFTAVGAYFTPNLSLKYFL